MRLINKLLGKKCHLILEGEMLDSERRTFKFQFENYRFREIPKIGEEVYLNFELEETRKMFIKHNVNYNKDQFFENKLMNSLHKTVSKRYYKIEDIIHWHNKNQEQEIYIKAYSKKD